MLGWEEVDVLHSPLLSLSSSVVDFQAAVAVEEDGGGAEDGGAVTVFGIFAAKFPIKSCFLLLGRLVATDVVVGRFLSMVVSMVVSMEVSGSSLFTKATGGANTILFASAGMRETK